MAYALREALAAFRRTPLLTALSVAMIALSLFVIGLFALAAHNIHRAIRDVESRVEVVAYIRDDAVQDAVTLARREIESFPEVRQVFFITREQALEKARRELPELSDLFTDLQVNPLPASFEISLMPGQYGPGVVGAVAERVASYPFVEEVRYGREWLDKVYLLRRVAAAAAVVVGAAFAAVAALIIGAAVRLAVFARREEIAIMRLVGATDGFVQRPFLLEGLLTGLLGGVLALGVTWGVYQVLDGSVIALAWIPEAWIVAGIVGGGLFGVLASGVSVRRHLGQI